jgi:hypothetical protein
MKNYTVLKNRLKDDPIALDLLGLFKTLVDIEKFQEAAVVGRKLNKHLFEKKNTETLILYGNFLAETITKNIEELKK